MGLFLSILKLFNCAFSSGVEVVDVTHGGPLSHMLIAAARVYLSLLSDSRLHFQSTASMCYSCCPAKAEVPHHLSIFRVLQSPCDIRVPTPLSLHALAADALLSLAAAELAREPDTVLRLTTAIPPVSLDDS